MSGLGKSWVEVAAVRLGGNFGRLEAAAGMAVLAVVKADGYGHGAALCAPVLVRAGARWLGVTDAAEGAAVRAALAEAAEMGDARPAERAESETGVLVMCGLLEEDAEAMVRHGLTPVVWTETQMGWLAAAVRRMDRRAGRRGALPVHVEVDTGMSRQGVRPGEELGGVLARLGASPELEMGGVMTHFASAEVVGSAQTMEQRARFAEALEQVAAAGLRPGWVHAGNTSATDNPEGAGEGWEETHEATHATHEAWLRRMAGRVGARPMVRSGLGLYGYRLPLEMCGTRELSGRGASGLSLAAVGEGPGLVGVEPVLDGVEPVLEGLAPMLEGVEPVMTWKTRVIATSVIGAGARVGYNGTFRARRPMRLALLPVGYADGLRRELSSGAEEGSGGWVMVRGRRAAIVGRVSMNLTTVDVTGVDGVVEGDEVVVLGEGVSAEDHARVAGTIAYEILCGVRAGMRRLV